MNAFILLAFGVLFAALFVASNALLVVRRTERIGFASTLLAFLTTVTLALSVTLAAVDRLGFVRPAVLLTAAVVAAFSALLLLSELRQQLSWKHSRGLLGVGLSAAVWLSALVASASVDALLASVAPSFSPTFAVSPQQNAPLEPTQRPTQPPTPTLSPSPSRTHTPTATTTATRPLRLTRTPTPTLTPVMPCLAQTLYNVNLRAGPSRTTERLTTVPFNTTLSLFARSADSAWWLTNYEGLEGWLAGEFLSLTAACRSLPIRD